MAEMKRVACMGAVSANMVAHSVDHSEATETPTFVDGMSLEGGGIAADTAVVLKRLGCDVCLLGKIGEDPLGAYIAEYLTEHDVDIDGLKRDGRTSTSASIALLDRRGRPRSYHCVGVNAAYEPEEVDLAIIRGCHVLHVAGAFWLPGLDGAPTAEILREARRAGITTSMDTAWDPSGPSGQGLEAIEPSLPQLDFFMSSLEEARQLTGLNYPEAILNYFLDRGPKTVVLKLPDAGCMARTADTRLSLSAEIAESVDFMGTGASFAAGFIRAFIQDWDLETCLRLANTMTAMCARHPGINRNLPSFEEAVGAMADMGSDDSIVR